MRSSKQPSIKILSFLFLFVSSLSLSILHEMHEPLNSRYYHKKASHCFHGTKVERNIEKRRKTSKDVENFNQHRKTSKNIEKRKTLENFVSGGCYYTLKETRLSPYLLR
jgi:hypothetical protein